MSAKITDVIAYWERQPCNVNHSSKPIGTLEYFAEVEYKKYRVEPHIQGFAEFPRWSGRHVLEIGCGIGTDAINFRRSRAIYTGIDISQTSVDLTNQRFSLEGFDERAYQYDAEDDLTIFADDSLFDLVYSFGVLHHTPNPRIVIGNIRRIIKPSGELRIMLYARNSWKYMMICEGLDQPEAQAGCPVAYTYTIQSVNELLKGFFDIRSIEQTHIFPYKIGKYKVHEYEKEPWFDAMDPGLFASMEKYFGWHLLIKAVPIETYSDRKR